MLKFEDIKAQAKTEKKTIKVKAWGGGEVEIRSLTIAETADIAATQMRGEGGMAMVKTASYALVEPIMSINDISNLDRELFDGVKEIVDAMEGFVKPKK